MLPSMWARAEKLVISAGDRRLLETWTRAHNAPQSVAMRCQVILLAADGVANNAIAKELGLVVQQSCCGATDSPQEARQPWWPSRRAAAVHGRSRPRRSNVW